MGIRVKVLWPYTFPQRSVLALVLVGWCVSGGGQRAYAEAVPPSLVELRNSHTIALIDDDAHKEVFVPVRKTGPVPLEQLQAYVASVELNQQVRPTLREAFRVEVRPAHKQEQTPQSTPDGLLIKVDFEQVNRPGLYDVKLVLLAPRADGSEQSQELPLQFSHAGAQLRPIASLVIHRELNAPWADNTLVPTTLELDNTSDTSRLNELSITQVGPARLGTEPITGRVRINHSETSNHSSPWILGPGGHQEPGIALEGEFPPGTATGTLEVRAPQLQAPVLIPFEVHSRRPGWLIPVIFFVGAIVGWICRNWLKQRQELLTLKSQAVELMARIDQELKTNPFPEQTQDLGGLRTRLQTAASAWDAKPLTEALQEANTALTQVSAARIQRRNKLFAEITATLEAVNAPWVLPPELKLGTLAEASEAARQRLVVDDLKGANQLHQQMQQQLVALARDGATWARNLGTELPRLIRDLPTTVVTDDVKQAQEQALQALQAVPDELATPPLSAEARLRGLHEASKQGRELIRRVMLSMGLLVDGAARQLELEPFKQADKARTLRNQAGKLFQDASGQTRINDAIQLLARGFSKLEGKVRQVINEQLEGIPRERASIEEALKEGKITDALTRTAHFVTEASTPTGRTRIRSTTPDTTATASGSSEGEWESAAAKARSFLERPDPKVTRQTGVVFVGGVAEPLHLVQARTLKSLLWVRLARGLVPATLLSLAAYVVTQSRFTGTWAEMLGLFVAAFGTDFTLDTALDQMLGSTPKT